MVSRWIALSVCVLVLIAGCGDDSDNGNDSNTSDNPTATTATNDSSADETPADSSSDDQQDSGSGAVEFVTVRDVRAGSTADVVVSTEPRAECTITYVSPEGNEESVRGLEPKTASGVGRVNWGWKIDPETPAGEATVTVTCNGETAETTLTIQ